MNPTLVATLAGTITAVAWGFGDWFSSRLAKKFDPIQINFGVSYMNIVLIAGLLALGHIIMPTAHQLLAITVAGVMTPAAYILFVKALKDGPVGVVVPLGNSYPLFTIMLSIVLLSQAFNSWQVGAMTGIVLGAMMLAYQRNRRQIPLRELHKDTALAVCAAFIWGFGFFVLNSVVADVNWQTITFFTEIVMFLVATFALIAVHGSRAPRLVRQALPNKLILGGGLVGAIGFVSFYVGSDYANNAVIPTVLSGCSTLVAALLGAILNHEKLGAMKRLGGALIVTGVIILNLA